MLKKVLSAPNYGIRLAQCIIVEWIFRFNIRVKHDRMGTPRPHHFDVRLVEDIQSKCEQLEVQPSFTPWALPPESEERFGLLWESTTTPSQSVSAEAPHAAVGEPVDDEVDPTLEEAFEASLAEHDESSDQVHPTLSQ